MGDLKLWSNFPKSKWCVRGQVPKIVWWRLWVKSHIIIARSWNLEHTSTPTTSYVCKENRVWPELNGSVAPPTNFQKPCWWCLHIHGILTACSTLDGQLCCAMRVSRRPTPTPTCARAQARSTLLAALIFLVVLYQISLHIHLGGPRLWLFFSFVIVSIISVLWLVCPIPLSLNLFGYFG